MRIIFTILLAAFLLQSCTQNGPGERPNVILIMCDDLNDYPAVYGGHNQAITPNMDKLAASGICFTNAQTNTPVCMPSRNSLFTGVYPHDSGDFGWTSRLKQPVLKHNKTLMHLLRENGYHLMGTGKLLHNNEPELWDEWGMKEGYNYGPFVGSGDTMSVHPGVPAPYRDIGPIDGSFGPLSAGPDFKGEDARFSWIYGRDMKPLRYENDDDRDLVQDELHAQWAVEMLKKHEEEGAGKPFFMGIGFIKPHTPLHAPQKFFDMYPIDQLELSEWLDGDKDDTYYLDNMSPNRKGPRYFRVITESYDGDSEWAVKHFLQAYLACVSHVDEQIGVVLDALEESPFRENTIVIFTSDHGWQMGEKEYMFKNSLWEESARIPMLIRAPGSGEGVSVDQPVALIDLFPTIADYCGLEGDNKLSEEGGAIGGHSLRPLIENPRRGVWDGPEGALTVIGAVSTRVPAEKQNYSYRTKDWRYLHYSDGSEELYDHVKDPFEWHNLAGKPEYADIQKELKMQMFGLINGAGEPSH